MKKILKLILLIVIIVAIVLVVWWLVGRNTAVKNGTSPVSFRSFIGLGDGNPLPGPDSGGLTPDTTGSQGTATTPDGNDDGIDDDFSDENDVLDRDYADVSVFTEGPLTPADSDGGGAGGGSTGGGGTSGGGGAGGGSTGGGGTSGGGGAGGGSTGGGGTSGGGTPPGDIPPVFPICSDADVTITFTPDEIRRLNALQTRFYAIAVDLRTDTDVDTELVNYDVFKAKADTIAEFYNYCQSKAPLITAAPYKTRVGTPYWYEPGKDQTGYLNNMRVYSTSSTFINNALNNYRIVNPYDQSRTKAVLEHLFKVNLW